jgi:hypothetical protein
VLLSFAQLRAIAAAAGFHDPDLMAAIAMAESGGDTSAVNDTRGLTDAQIRAKFRLAPGTPVKQEWSIGLWQINALTGDVDPVRLKDPNYNAQVAYARSSGGTDLNPWWLTVSRGAYKKFLPAGYAAPLPEFSGVVAPARSSGSAALAAVGALALAAAAGLAVRAGQSRREPEPPLPWP